MSNRTDLRRPVVCGDVEPRHALQIEEADEHAQYVTAKDAAEDIALPIFSAVMNSLIYLVLPRSTVCLKSEASEVNN